MTTIATNGALHRPVTARDGVAGRRLADAPRDGVDAPVLRAIARAAT
jgi:hypothetical protein